MKNKEHRQHSLPEEARSYYEMGLEVNRLSGAGGQLELVRTQEIIRRYLPGPPAVVLTSQSVRTVSLPCRRPGVFSREAVD